MTKLTLENIRNIPSGTLVKIYSQRFDNNYIGYIGELKGNMLVIANAFMYNKLCKLDGNVILNYFSTKLGFNLNTIYGTLVMEFEFKVLKKYDFEYSLFKTFKKIYYKRLAQKNPTQIEVLGTKAYHVDFFKYVKYQ